MDPSASQQQPQAMKHMMSIPEKIELTSTGAYPSSPQSSGQRQDTHVYRAMRVPDKILLESTGEEGEEVGQGGRQVVGGASSAGGYLQQTIPFSSEPLSEAHVVTATDNTRRFRETSGQPAVEQKVIQNLDQRVQSLENQMRTLRQAVLQQSGREGQQRQGSRVWYALTFAGWLMVPLVVVFMFHYRKTAH